MNESQTIIKFSTRVRQLIYKHKELKEEITRLRAAIEEKDAKIASLEQKVSDAKKEYDTLKFAKMLQIHDHDLAESKQRISKMIRTINQCIALLSARE